MKHGRGASWETDLARCFNERASTLHLVGVGNPLGRDDAVGLYVISELRKRYGARPNANLRIHAATPTPERILSRMGGAGGRVVVFDAVECNREPGHLFCGKLADSKVGFFATHDMPLSLFGDIGTGTENAWVVGVQPKDTDFGEGLTEEVRRSADVLVDYVGKLMEGRPNGRS